MHEEHLVYHRRVNSLRLPFHMSGPPSRALYRWTLREFRRLPTSCKKYYLSMARTVRGKRIWCLTQRCGIAAATVLPTACFPLGIVLYTSCDVEPGERCVIAWLLLEMWWPCSPTPVCVSGDRSSLRM